MLSNRGLSVASPSSMSAAGSAALQFNLKTNYSRSTANNGYLLKTVVFIILAALVLSITYYSILYELYQPQQESSSVSTSTSSMPSPHRKGFYGESKNVFEILSQEEYHKAVSSSHTPTAIVYYASWCGHCR